MLKISKSVSLVGIVALLLISTTTPALSAAPASELLVKAKITKPAAPTVVSIVSSTPKNGKVNLKVTISLPTANGGSNITGSKVSAGSKSCMIKKTKTSCTLKSIKNGKTVKVFAKSKNKKGFGPSSVKVTYVAGAGAYPAAPAAIDAPAPSVPTTPPVALTCATGGTCLVGDTGPGGGLIYFVYYEGFQCGSEFTIYGSPTGGVCHYLEVAPSGWEGSAGDPAKVWAVPAYQSTDVSGITDEASANNSTTGIGLGYKNSMAIVTQNGAYSASTNNYAAGAARAYAGGSKGDWYLPTTAELNLLCQWARGVAPSVTTACTDGSLNSGTGASGGFVDGSYWSSSEYDARNAWVQYFNDGYQSGSGKGNTSYVRPVRAF